MAWATQLGFAQVLDIIHRVQHWDPVSHLIKQSKPAIHFISVYVNVKN